MRAQEWDVADVAGDAERVRAETEVEAKAWVAERRVLRSTRVEQLADGIESN